MFTLLIKATTISFMMRKMWVTKLKPLEEFEYDEAKILSNIKILKELNRLYERTYLTFDEYSELKNKYENKLQDAINLLKGLLESEWKNSYNLVKRALSLYALGVEKKYLKELFEYNEISEINFTFILKKISRQIERLEEWNYQFSRKVDDRNENYDIFEKIINHFRFKSADHINKYIRNRTRVIITRRVVKELKILLEIEFPIDKKIIEDIIEVYQSFHNEARAKMDYISNKYKSSIMIIESNLTNKTLLKIEEEVIENLYEKEIITPKLYIKFKDEIEEWIEEDVKKIYLKKY